MKTRQEQIEEMAKDIYKCKNCPSDCNNSCGCYFEASRYYKAGYRKASDVIDEFVERLKQVLNKHEHRSQTDGVPFYQMNAESFCDEIEELTNKLLQEM